jgi:hypothetical protein
MRSDAANQREQLATLRAEEQELLASRPNQSELLDAVTADIDAWRRRILANLGLGLQLVGAASPEIITDPTSGQSRAVRRADVSMTLGRLDGIAALVLFVPGLVKDGVLAIVHDEIGVSSGPPMVERLERLDEVRRQIAIFEARQRELAGQAAEIARSAQEAVRG